MAAHSFLLSSLFPELDSAKKCSEEPTTLVESDTSEYFSEKSPNTSDIRDVKSPISPVCTLNLYPIPAPVPHYPEYWLDGRALARMPNLDWMDDHYKEQQCSGFEKPDTSRFYKNPNASKKFDELWKKNEESFNGMFREMENGNLPEFYMIATCEKSDRTQKAEKSKKKEPKKKMEKPYKRGSQPVAGIAPAPAPPTTLPVQIRYLPPNRSYPHMIAMNMFYQRQNMMMAHNRHVAHNIAQNLMMANQLSQHNRSGQQHLENINVTENQNSDMMSDKDRRGQDEIIDVEH